MNREKKVIIQQELSIFFVFSVYRDMKRIKNFIENVKITQVFFSFSYLINVYINKGGNWSN